MKVYIMLATYNGAFFLSKQLDSIFNQTFKNIFLVVSDDGSNDETIEILHNYKKKYPNNMDVIIGPKKGFMHNFISLIVNYAYDQNAFYAFSDQDDIWHIDKIEKALKDITKFDIQVPVLYCSRTKLIDENDNFIGFSPLFQKKPSFKNALVQNIGGGNTMVFNQASFNLIKNTPDECEIVSHDWWLYILVSGAGGHILYDPFPTVDYRQHSKNTVGSNLGFLPLIGRLYLLLNGKYKKWVDCNLKELMGLEYILNDENRNILKELVLARKQTYFKRIFSLYRLNLYRQTYHGNLALKLAILLNRF